MAKYTAAQAARDLHRREQKLSKASPTPPKNVSEKKLSGNKLSESKLPGKKFPGNRYRLFMNLHKTVSNLARRGRATIAPSTRRQSLDVTGGGTAPLHRRGAIRRSSRDSTGGSEGATSSVPAGQVPRQTTPESRTSPNGSQFTLADSEAALGSRSKRHPNSPEISTIARGLGVNGALEDDCMNASLFQKATDSVSYLSDMNILRWLVWAMNRSKLLPHLFLPSEEHFTFGSVHDVSHLLNNVEDYAPERTSRPAYWMYALYQRSASGCQRSVQVRDQPRAQSNVTIPLGTVSNVAGPRNSAAFLRPDGKEIDQNANEVTIKVEEVASSTALPNAVDDLLDLATKPIQQHLAVDPAGVVEVAESSRHSTDVDSWLRVWFQLATLIALSLLLLAFLRYVVQLVSVLLFWFLTDLSIAILWSPLLYNLLNSVALLLTSVLLFRSRSRIEDLLITSTAFLKPFTAWPRTVLRLLPALFFATHLLVVLVGNLLGFTLMLCQEEHLGLFADGSTLLGSLGLQAANESTPISHWHLYETLWWPRGGEPLPVLETSSEPDSTVFEEESSSSCTGASHQTLAIDLTSWWWTILYFADFLLRTSLASILSLVKAWHFAQSLVIILKSHQLVGDTKKITAALSAAYTANNRAKEPVPVSVPPHDGGPGQQCLSVENNNANQTNGKTGGTKMRVESAGVGPRSSSVTLVHRQMEALNSMAQVQIGNIREYETIYGPLLVVWILVSLCKLSLIPEMKECYFEAILPQSKFSMDPIEVTTVSLPLGTSTLPTTTRPSTTQTPFTLNSLNLTTVLPTIPVPVEWFQEEGSFEPSATGLLYHWFEYLYVLSLLALECLDILLFLLCCLLIRIYRYQMLSP